MKPLDPRVLPHLRPAARPLGVVVVGSVLGGILAVAQAFALAGLVVALLRSSPWENAAWALVGVTVARALTGWLVERSAARAAGQVTARLRRLVVSAALRGDESRTGERGLLATRGVEAVEPYLTRYLPALVVATVLPGLVLLAIAGQDLLSALVVLLTLPLLPVFAILVGLTTKQRADREWRALATLSGHFLDVVRGLPTLVAWRRADAQTQRIRTFTDAYRRRATETLRLAFASSASLELLATLSVAMVAVSTGLRLAAGSLDLHTALVVLLLAPEAYWPIRRVGAEFHAAAEGTATFEAVHALATDVEAVPVGTLAASGDLVVRDLTVRYDDRGAAVLDRLSVDVPARGLTAIIGPSGCGKSTLLDVLLGELAASSGEVLLGGTPIADDPSSWQRRVAHVGQRPWIRSGTVGENVRIGRPAADTADVLTALAAVDLSLDPDSDVGEDGHLLSAGQRARLALARVLVSERPWVLLDEPTAHLDPTTEAVLLRVLLQLAEDRAVVVVAHRPALVDAADRVIRLPGGSEPVAPPTPHLLGRSASKSLADDNIHTTVGAARPPERTLPRWLGPLLAILAAASGVALTATAGWLIARAAEHPPVLVLTVAIVGVRTFGLARPLLRYAERLVTHDVALRALAVRRAEVYESLVPLVPARLGRRRGDLLASVVDDVDALVDEQVRVRLPLVTWAGVSVLATALAAWLVPAAGLVVAGTTLLGGLGAWTLASWAARNHEPAMVAARAELSDRVVEALASARSLRLWQYDGPALAGIDATGRDLVEATQRASAGVSLGRGVATLSAGAGVAAMAAVTAPALADRALSGPMLALLVLLPLALADVLLPMADAGALRHRTRAAVARLDALAATEPAVIDPAQPATVDTERPGVRLAGVAAGWDGPRVLEDLDLDLAPGRHVGVVGPSGSGKSTLAALLMRFLAPQSGSQQLGGRPVEELAGDEVRRLVGLVDDDPYLFASSVAENVRLARPESSDAEVERALRAAHLGDWLDGLEGGLRTRIGEGAAQPSGGERARLGLARAVLADQPVLVLDEPTAHLDNATAQAVTDDLLAASRDRSLVWITHGTIGLAAMDEVLTLSGAPAGLPREREPRARAKASVTPPGSPG